MRLISFVAGAALATGSLPVHAEETAPARADAAISEEADVMTMVPDPATVAMPKLQFAASAQDESNYDKYFYFHRADTTFEQALTDLRDCDGLSRGLTSGQHYQQAPYPYTNTMAGAVGSALGNALAQAISGSAEKRRVRRINMRRCMGYKGYARFGLAKELWEQFNFEEGLGTKEEAFRQARLAQQAKVASGPAPTAAELGL